MSNNPHTVVTVLDDPSVDGKITPHIAKRVFVNGQQVRLEPDGVDIAFGPSEATVVTLRLLVDEIHFKH